MNAKPALEGAWVFRHERRLMGWGSTLKGCYEGSSPQLSWDLEVLDRGQRQEEA